MSIVDKFNLHILVRTVLQSIFGSKDERKGVGNNKQSKGKGFC